MGKNNKSASALTWLITNYLNKHQIYPHNKAMHDTIIREYYKEFGENSDAKWMEIVKDINANFSHFCQHVQNNWKHKE